MFVLKLDTKSRSLACIYCDTYKSIFSQSIPVENTSLEINCSLSYFNLKLKFMLYRANAFIHCQKPIHATMACFRFDSPNFLLRKFHGIIHILK